MTQAAIESIAVVNCYIEEKTAEETETGTTEGENGSWWPLRVR